MFVATGYLATGLNNPMMDPNRRASEAHASHAKFKTSTPSVEFILVQSPARLTLRFDYPRVHYGGREWPLKVRTQNQKSISKSSNSKLEVDC